MVFLAGEVQDPVYFKDLDTCLEYSEKIKIQENEPLKSELIEFIDCIYARKSPLTDHKEAVKVQTIIDMIDKKI